MRRAFLAVSGWTFATRVGQPAMHESADHIGSSGATGAHHIGELEQDVARKVCQHRLEEEADVSRSRHHDQSLALLYRPRLLKLFLTWIEPINLRRKRLRQIS